MVVSIFGTGTLWFLVQLVTVSVVVEVVVMVESGSSRLSFGLDEAVVMRSDMVESVMAPLDS